MADLVDKVVPVARRLPSNAEYLAHLSSVAGDGLIRLASNESADPPSPRVRRALARAFEDANRYPAPSPPLSAALAERHGVRRSQVLVTAGSTEVIDATLRTFARAGDEVVLPAPSWPVYSRRLQAIEACTIEVPLDRDSRTWHYDASRFIEVITPATKLVIVCTPNNPTGNAMPPADLERIAATGVPLLIDGAYCDFQPDLDLVSLVHRYDGVVLTRTFSKAYALAGLRLGYALGSAEVLGYVERFLVPGSAVSSAALHAGLAALCDDRHQRRQVRRVIAERERVRSALRERGLPVWRSECNFLAIDGRAFPGGATGLAAAILAHGIVVRPLGDIVRVTVGRKEENDALIAAAAAAWSRHGEHGGPHR